MWVPPLQVVMFFTVQYCIYSTVYKVQYYSILISIPGCPEANVIEVAMSLAQY